MNVPLCPVCGGRGVVCSCARGEVSPHSTDVGHTLADIRRLPPPCPNGCVGVKVVDHELGAPGNAGAHDCSRLQCPIIVRYLDPAVVRLWCTVHQSSVHVTVIGSIPVCHLAEANRNRGIRVAAFCNPVPVRIEKLGELA